MHKFITNIQDKGWRLNNLYHILDKDGKIGILKLNPSQLVVLAVPNLRKIILKSRQQGISTYALADNLDSCLFIEGYQAGIQSYGRDETIKLYKRAIVMWNKLDFDIKLLLGITLVSSNSTNGLEFSNGSSLKIGNFRGDTLQSLHISELAKISMKYPDKALELQTGAFQAVGINNIITIETTAEGNTGLFPDLWYISTGLLDAGIELTPLDFYPIFLSWLDDADCSMDYYTPPTKILEEYLVDLKKELPDVVLTKQQTYWLTVKLRELGDKFNREYPATPAMAFAQSIEGTYFKKQYDVIKAESRITKVQHNPNYKVYTSWDLGINDEMVVLFWQVIGGITYLFDEYHNTGEGLEHYVMILRDRQAKFGYIYIRHFFPHDISVTELGTGRTRYSVLVQLGVTDITILKKLSFMESIAVARTMMLSRLYISTTCRGTVSGIQNYRRRKDVKLDFYTGVDIHDIHSNYMASFRYGSQGLTQHLVEDTKIISKYSSNSNKVPQGSAL